MLILELKCRCGRIHTLRIGGDLEAPLPPTISDEEPPKSFRWNALGIGHCQCGEVFRVAID